MKHMHILKFLVLRFSSGCWSGSFEATFDLNGSAVHQLLGLTGKSESWILVDSVLVVVVKTLLIYT